jgi:hypothetical protein
MVRAVQAKFQRARELKYSKSDIILVPSYTVINSRPDLFVTQLGLG